MGIWILIKLEVLFCWYKFHQNLFIHKFIKEKSEIKLSLFLIPSFLSFHYKIQLTNSIK